VNGISFTVNKGEIVAFWSNWCGKSTTMKMITGYLEPDGGNISVSGIDVRKQPLEVKKKVGYLPESNALYYDLYIREYLGFMADVHGLQIKAAH
jgi:ABC-2 type transport system ATP-binding protein